MNDLKLFAVAGKPIGHSLSPEMHNAAFKEQQINAHYFRLIADETSEVFDLAKKLRISGMNITSPFKESSIEFIEDLDESAKNLFAVNSVTINQNLACGFNTDIAGVTGLLNHNKITLDSKKVVVLGAGGAAKAVLTSLKNLEALKVTVINRTIEKGKKVAQLFGYNFAPISNLGAIIGKSDILINCLPRSITLVTPHMLNPETIIIDAAYPSSSLLEMAKRVNCKTISGLDWLLFQAVDAYQIFNGIEAPFEIIKQALATGKKRTKNISLIGFMGAGKTTVGRHIAKKLGMRFIDTDEIITQKTGKSCAEIFATDGESKFREIETSVLLSLENETGCVISCGGGAVIKDENRSILSSISTVIWLWVSPDIVIKRAKKDRPLLQATNPLATANKLLSERHLKYASITDMVIDTDIRNEIEVAKRIYNEIR